MRCLILEIGEILNDAVHYPLDHPKDLLVYIILDIIITIMGIAIGAGSLLHSAQSDIPNIITSMTSSGAVPAFNYFIRNAGTIGIVIVLIIMIINLFINGYGLDIIKLGIERRDEGPKIDIVRQIINGIKILVINFVYMFIPLIIMLILMQIHEIIGGIIGIVLLVLFAFGLLMAQCRLAKNEKITDALNIAEAFNDIKKVGIIKILATVLVIFIIGIVLEFILSAIVRLLIPLGLNLFIGPILAALVGAYIFFLSYRAIGLMYSDAE